MSKAYLETDDVAILEKAATNMRDRLLIRLLFHLGCRVSESLAISVEDVDFDAGTITIQHLKTRLKLSCPQCGVRLGRSNVFCSKCGIKVEKTVADEREHRRLRTLPVDSETLEMLADFVRRDKTQGLIFRH